MNIVYVFSLTGEYLGWYETGSRKLVAGYPPQGAFALERVVVDNQGIVVEREIFLSDVQEGEDYVGFKISGLD